MTKTYTVPPQPHHNEGKTVAAWTMNMGIVIGSVVLALGMILPDAAAQPQLSILVWIGAGLIVLAILAGVGLSLAGLGQPRRAAAESEAR